MRFNYNFVSLYFQTLMFSATNEHSHRCDHGRGTIHALPHTLNHSRCSCEGPTPQGYNNRLLLPATSHINEQIRVQTNLPVSYVTVLVCI